MIFIQALRKNDINPNGGKQVEFGKAFFEPFHWKADTVHEVIIHIGSETINTTLKVRGSQRGGDREGVDCKEYANSNGIFPLKDFFINKVHFTQACVGQVYLILVPLDENGKEFELNFTPFKNRVKTSELYDREQPLQQIFYGAPGTGKSFKIKRDTTGQSVIRTTFHPDSDYSTFVGCYKPTMDEDITYDKNGKETSHTKQIVYSFVAQAFLQAYVKAWQFYCEPEGGEIKPQFLIIEEINRGNCAQIFGDLFQLLDRNSEDGFSSYPIFADMDVKKYLEKVFEDFSFPDSLISYFPDYNGNIADDIKKGIVLVLPSNLYIWATMNTSDQSLFPIDSAFKRRWDWKYIPIDTAKEKWDIVVAGQKYSWTKFLDTINAEIFDVTKSEDKKMGFYFCRAKNHVIDAEKFVGKVIFYIYNDVFKDYGFDRQMFENENGAPIQFHEYYKNDGSVNEEMVTKFLTNLKLNQQAEGKDENE